MMLVLSLRHRGIRNNIRPGFPETRGSEGVYRGSFSVEKRNQHPVTVSTPEVRSADVKWVRSLQLGDRLGVREVLS